MKGESKGMLLLAVFLLRLRDETLLQPVRLLQAPSVLDVVTVMGALTGQGTSDR